MSRLVWSRRRTVSLLSISRFSLVLITTAAIVLSVSIGQAAADASRILPERDTATESLSAGRFLKGLSAPTIRVFVDGEDSPPLEISRLRTIDEDESAGLVTAFEPQLQRRSDRITRVFSTPRGSEWIREQPADESESLLYSLREDGGASVVPVRGLSIPNPLNLISNPFRWGGRFRAEYGTNFDDLHLLRGNLIVNSGAPIAFDTEFNYRNDDVRAHTLNDFWTGDFNLVYRIGKIRYAEIRAGVGINWLAGTDTTDFGFNATYGVDFNIMKPWIISTSADWGTLGSDALLHMRITGGLDLGRFELYVGYDFYEVGSREWKAVVAGVGMWF